MNDKPQSKISGTYGGAFGVRPEDDTSEGADDNLYRAFRTVREGGAHSLDLRQTDGKRTLLPLAHLLAVEMTEGPDFDLVSLCFPDRIVTLKGRHLVSLVDALHARKLSRVQVYDPARWALPEKGKAVVERIDVG